MVPTQSGISTAFLCAEAEAEAEEEDEDGDVLSDVEEDFLWRLGRGSVCEEPADIGPSCFVFLVLREWYLVCLCFSLSGICARRLAICVESCAMVCINCSGLGAMICSGIGAAVCSCVGVVMGTGSGGGVDSGWGVSIVCDVGSADFVGTCSVGLGASKGTLIVELAAPSFPAVAGVSGSVASGSFGSASHWEGLALSGIMEEPGSLLVSETRTEGSFVSVTGTGTVTVTVCSGSFVSAVVTSGNLTNGSGNFSASSGKFASTALVSRAFTSRCFASGAVTSEGLGLVSGI